MTTENLRKHNLFELSKPDLKKVLGSVMVEEDDLIKKCFENAGRVVEEPTDRSVRETARMVANDPAMNLLCSFEASTQYKDSLLKSRLSTEAIDEMCGEFVALPLNEEVRITKIQTMFSLLKKSPTAVSSENGRTPIPDKAIDFIEY